METKTCDNCGRIMENRGFSMKAFIEWPRDNVGKSHGNVDFCSIGCFIEWAIKHLELDRIKEGGN